MPQYVAQLTLLVREYDEAVAFYTEKLGFQLVADTPLSPGKRWVIVAPAGAASVGLLLAKAADARQQSQVGNQAGGRVLLFLNTDDFWRDHTRLVAAGVRFRETPREEVYATVAVFEDLYGNLWDLLQPKTLPA